MARIIGRKACPWCGFQAAHVKQSEGKHPYHHCPECGVMTHAKNGQQARAITNDMRPEPDYKAVHPAPTPPATDDPIVVKGGKKLAAKATRTEPAAPAVATDQDKTQPKPRAGLWDTLMGGN